MEEMNCTCVNGYIFDRKEGPLGYPYDVVRLCPRCLEQSIRRRLPASISGGWEAWKPVPELSHAVGMLKNWKGSPWSVLLHADANSSNLGTGKTHAAWATSIAFASHGKTSRFWRASDYIEACRQAAANEVPWPTVLGPGHDLFILDDLGQDRTTAFGIEQVELLVDSRWSAQAPMLVTSNLTAAQIAETYPRAASRFQDGLMIPWRAPDYRIRRNR